MRTYCCVAGSGGCYRESRPDDYYPPVFFRFTVEIVLIRVINYFKDLFGLCSEKNYSSSDCKGVTPPLASPLLNIGGRRLKLWINSFDSIDSFFSLMFFKLSNNA